MYTENKSFRDGMTSYCFDIFRRMLQVRLSRRVATAFSILQEAWIPEKANTKHMYHHPSFKIHGRHILDSVSEFITVTI